MNCGTYVGYEFRCLHLFTAMVSPSPQANYIRSGGYREGPSRPRDSLNKATMLRSHRLSGLAKGYTHDALLTLVDVAKNSWSGAAGASAATAPLDRGHGEPAAQEEIKAVDLPPIVIQIRAPDDDATEKPATEARG